MARRDTFWGAYDISLEKELRDYQKKMREIGIKKPTKMEASCIVANKAKKTKLSQMEIKRIVMRRRGLL